MFSKCFERYDWRGMAWTIALCVVAVSVVALICRVLREINARGSRPRHEPPLRSPQLFTRVPLRPKGQDYWKRINCRDATNFDALIGEGRQQLEVRIIQRSIIDAGVTRICFRRTIMNAKGVPTLGANVNNAASVNPGEGSTMFYA